MNNLMKTLRAFAIEQDGIALTEYLVLLGLLAGGVIGTVTLAGQSLGVAWGSWTSFWDALPS